MGITLTYARHGEEIEQEFPDVPDAFRYAWVAEGYGEIYALELREGDTVLYSDREGVPWAEGTVPLHDAMLEYAIAHDWD